MPEGTKYDSVLDAMKVTEAEYRGLLSSMTLEFVQERSGAHGASTGKMRNWAQDYLEGHEWFQEFDGATCGAIVEFSDVDAQVLTRWHCQPDAQQALEVMAEEAIIEDFVAALREQQAEVFGKVSGDGN